MVSIRWTAVSLVLGVVLATSGCDCAGSNVQVTEDAGQNLTECVTTADCPLGKSCVDGQCVLGEGESDAGFDAGVECTENAHCPTGFVCLKSESRCIPEQIVDAGEEDAGQPDCFEGDVRACGASKLGECRLGTEACEAGAWSGACVGAVLPASDGCDSRDNDCDGLVDEDFNKLTDVNNCGSCGNVCSYPFAQPICQSGSCQMGPCDPGHVDLNNDPLDGCEYACSVTNGGVEICDGKDNDCDGLKDEALPDLSCGIGACARTVPACVGGAPQTCVPGQEAPETCDGQDNNCDGTADNGIANLTCGKGECFRSVPACQGTAPNTCTPGTANPTELCDGKDDDCDGSVDEGCACIDGNVQSCYSGSPDTAGKGVCVAGSQTCSGGQWGPCNGEVADTPEVCDGDDNDCDGVVDDGLSVITCGVGACRRTVSTCLNGQPNSTCNPGSPSAEVCDNVDNDCNGQTDEGTISCGVGACRVTVNKCAAGADNTCTQGTPTTEVCDTVDNDCNGQTDETYPQAGQSCSTGQFGLCGTGTRSCTAGTLGCQQTVQPTNEVCNNGLDENCNGTVDDPTACGCNAAIDKDLDGANECVDCNDTDGTIKPGGSERCNGRDDNCNLSIDEGFDQDSDGFSTCGTVPGGGVDVTRIDCNDTNNFVFPGKVADCGSAATPASPNSVDDNCNGYTDETCNCSNVDTDGDGLTGCQGDCDNSDNTVRPGRTELCDGKDNDCDKDTTANCGVSDPCGVKSGSTWNTWPTGTDQCRAGLLCTQTVDGSGRVTAMTCGSLCNQTLGLGLRDSCAAGEGCSSTLFTAANLHVCSVTPVGTKTTGQACVASSECRSGWCLSQGGQSFCSDRCTHESGCSNNTTCTPLKQLSPGSSGPFSYYYYLGYCKLDSIITGTKTLGQTCTGAECKTGTDGCFNTRCIEPCCGSADCPTGYGCSINGPRSYTGYVTSGTPSAEIWSAVPACLSTSGGKTQGQVCAASSECKSGICEKTMGVCIDLCCNDTGCANGNTCEMLDFRWSDGKKTSVRACVKAPFPAKLEQK